MKFCFVAHAFGEGGQSHKSFPTPDEVCCAFLFMQTATFVAASGLISSTFWLHGLNMKMDFCFDRERSSRFGE